MARAEERDHDSPVAIATFVSEGEALVAQAQLRAAGIWSALRRTSWEARVESSSGVVVEVARVDAQEACLVLGVNDWLEMPDDGAMPGEPIESPTATPTVRMRTVGALSVGLLLCAVALGLVTRGIYLDSCTSSSSGNVASQASAIGMLLVMAGHLVPITLSFVWRTPWWLRVLAILALLASLVAGVAVVGGAHCPS